MANFLDIVQKLKSNLEFLKGFEDRWFVVGGWALDLHIKYQSREHHDLDVGIFRKSQLNLQELLLRQGWKLEWMQSGTGHPWKKDEYLQLPIHEIWAFRSEPNIEILLNESDAENWRYRRDTKISLPFRNAILEYEGIPYLAPEAVLLFKSKHIRPVDNQDFETLLPHLSKQQREWLKAALVSQNTTHPWLESLK